MRQRLLQVGSRAMSVSRDVSLEDPLPDIGQVPPPARQGAGGCRAGSSPARRSPSARPRSRCQRRYGNQVNRTRRRVCGLMEAVMPDAAGSSATVERSRRWYANFRQPLNLGCPVVTARRPRLPDGPLGCDRDGAQPDLHSASCIRWTSQTSTKRNSRSSASSC
jgi:hypothetical protein